MFSLIAVLGRAQNTVVMNLPYEDMNRFHLGFHIGVHTQDLKISNSGFVDPDGRNYFSEVPYFSPGFSVGIMGDVTLIDGIDVRIVPTLHFGDRPITFTDGVSTIDKIDNKSQILSFPLLIKYSSLRYNNIRPYVTAGVFGEINLGAQKHQTIAFTRTNYGIQFGVGCDIYLPYFKLCPEISFAYGLKNSINNNRKDLIGDNRIFFTQSINKIQSKMVLLSFYFE